MVPAGAILVRPPAGRPGQHLLGVRHRRPRQPEPPHPRGAGGPARRPLSRPRPRPHPRPDHGRHRHREQAARHVPVPPGPAPGFVLVEPALPPGQLQALLRPPRAPRHADELGRRGRPRPPAEVVGRSSSWSGCRRTTSPSGHRRSSAGPHRPAVPPCPFRPVAGAGLPPTRRAVARRRPPSRPSGDPRRTAASWPGTSVGRLAGVGPGTGGTRRRARTPCPRPRPHSIGQPRLGREGHAADPPRPSRPAGGRRSTPAAGRGPGPSGGATWGSRKPARPRPGRSRLARWYRGTGGPRRRPAGRGRTRRPGGGARSGRSGGRSGCRTPPPRPPGPGRGPPSVVLTYLPPRRQSWRGQSYHLRL
jgi:hypothetical protein